MAGGVNVNTTKSIAKHVNIRVWTSLLSVYNIPDRSCQVLSAYGKQAPQPFISELT